MITFYIIDSVLYSLFIPYIHYTINKFRATSICSLIQKWSGNSTDNCYTFFFQKKYTGDKHLCQKTNLSIKRGSISYSYCNP